MALQRMSGPLQLTLGPAVTSHPSIAASLVASAEASSDYISLSDVIPPYLPTSKPTSVMCSPLLSGFVCAGACSCSAFHCTHAPLLRGCHFFTVPLSLVLSPRSPRCDSLSVYRLRTRGCWPLCAVSFGRVSTRTRWPPSSQSGTCTQTAHCVPGECEVDHASLGEIVSFSCTEGCVVAVWGGNHQEPVRHLRAAVRGGGLVWLHPSACQGWAGLPDDGPGGWVSGGGPAAGPAEHWGRGTGRLRPQARLAPRGQRKVGPWCGTRAEGCAPRCLWAPWSLRARCAFAISYAHTFSCHVMPFLFVLVFLCGPRLFRKVFGFLLR